MTAKSWKGAPDKYLIYDDGRIWSVYTKRFMVPTQNLLGYKRVKLGNKSYQLHRILAETFLKNDDPSQKIYVNHIDSDPFNNDLSNLEWVTPSENSQKARKKAGRHWNQLQEEDLEGFVLRTFESMSDCARTLGVHRTTLQQKLMRHGGSFKTAANTTIRMMGGKKNLPSPAELTSARVVPGFKVLCTPSGLLYSAWDQMEISLHQTGFYLQATVRDEMGHRSTEYAHRLIALAFHGTPPDSTYEVDHVNGDCLDNCAENLEWVTPAENKRRWAARLEKKGVQLISRQGHIITSFDSVREAAHTRGISPDEIYHSVRSRGSSATTWRWKPEDDCHHVDVNGEFCPEWKRIILRDAITEEAVRSFGSVQEGARKMGVSWPTMKKRCEQKKVIDSMIYAFE